DRELGSSRGRRQVVFGRLLVGVQFGVVERLPASEVPQEGPDPAHTRAREQTQSAPTDLPPALPALVPKEVLHRHRVFARQPVGFRHFQPSHGSPHIVTTARLEVWAAGRIMSLPRPPRSIMVVTCPRCRRSLSSVSADSQPMFCMYCGQKLTD